ncbi:uncharacterized protein BX664DRAFT_330471 [Halteromyces radiatus]|uniref:uncharacterized protein n=1 Tax=Halteromyces radiatus TaxID=101107 RepID=UPI00221E59DF|nr:uncharacterized protein BX664DRAFT_330471 [Halteromyces radiatus]KAI8093741.1 hypothetical protein BX664DRAFT_330471 [Halteromyces radiatus]
MYCKKLLSLLGLFVFAFHVCTAAVPVQELIDSGGQKISQDGECFSFYSPENDKWLIADSKGWLQFSSLGASTFQFKTINNNTETSLGCRLTLLKYKGAWKTIKNQRQPGGGDYSSLWSYEGVLTTTYHASRISEFVWNDQRHFLLDAGFNSEQGYGAVGPYATYLDKNSNWLVGKEVATRGGRALFYIFKQNDCSPTNFYPQKAPLKNDVASKPMSGTCNK